MKFLLALLAAGKFGKLLTTGGTMLISVVAYAFVYGWRYAVGLVAMIFVHEAGHFIAARKCGLDVGAPVFIPFVGAWVALKTTELDPETEAYVGIAGPLLGSAGAFICYLVARESGEKLLMAIAYSGFFINVFNLIPLSPFDGGRIVAVISPKIWFVGIPVLLATLFWQPSPILLLVAVLAAPQLWAVLRGKESTSRTNVPTATKLVYGFGYIALATTLAVLALDAHERLSGS